MERAAAILSTGVRFLEGRYGEIEPSVEMKRTLVGVIRTVRPDIVITQDPEHSFDDLDPDRRPAMILYLEALALAGATGRWRRREAPPRMPCRPSTT